MPVGCRWLWRGSGSVERDVVVTVEDGRITGFRRGSGHSGFLMPSFTDAHCHFTGMGLRTLYTDLSSARSAGDVLDLLAVSARRHPGHGMIRAHSLDESMWPDPALPDPASLDRACGDRPVIVRRICGHMAIANSAMLAMLPAGAANVDPRTGILTEDIVLRFGEVFPARAEDYSRAIEASVRMAGASGVTRVFSIEEPGGYRALAGSAGDLAGRIRVVTALPWESLDMAVEEADRLASPDGPGQQWFDLRGIKFFLDGSFGAETAAIEGSYEGSGGSGELLWSGEELASALRETLGRGFEPVVHAIGARALRAVMSASEGLSSGTVRIEHAEELMPTWPGQWKPDVHRFCMQPGFVDQWQGAGGLYSKRLGERDAKRLNPFDTLLSAGFELGFGSDGMPFGPLRGLGGATGHPLREEALDVEAALRAYTTGSARLCGRGHGSAPPLVEGGPADMVLLSENPFEMGETPEWSGIEVLRTWVDGRVVHDSSG